jgi:hypothetical protein
LEIEYATGEHRVRPFVTNFDPLPASAAAAGAATTFAAPSTPAGASTRTTIPAPSARAARTAALARPRLIHADRATLEFRLVEILDCARSFVRVRHLDEAKTARLAREFVHHYRGAIDLACLREKRFQVFIRH